MGSQHGHTIQQRIGKMFFDEGAPIFLRTQNLISSTKHAMNLLVKKKKLGPK